VISIHWNLNLDYLLEKLWEYLDLTRVYTKPRGIKVRQAAGESCEWCTQVEPVVEKFLAIS
jgi:ribosome-interacting GTPase 1